MKLTKHKMSYILPCYDRCIWVSLWTWGASIVLSLLFPKEQLLIILLPSIFILVYFLSICIRFMTMSVEDLRQNHGDFLKNCDSILHVVDESLSSEQECIICYNQFHPEKGMEAVQIACACKNHYYHRECIYEWFIKKSTCPICRVDFRLTNHRLRS